jgi:tRNA pseudouridine55 synthase
MLETKSGIVILNKEAGISSNTAVNKVKHAIGAKKAGHLGTLDMLGEGVLPVTLNKATRLFDYFLQKDKVYRAVFVFGFETSTLDCEGEIANINYHLITHTEIEKALRKFKGKIKQVPPQFSALKVKGKTAYDLARKGERVELAAREVEIYDFKLLQDVEKDKKEELEKRFFQFHNIDLLQNEEIKNSLKNNVFEFEITCSSGTYIRSLCRDLAHQLTTYGTMLCIVRTRSGAFKLEEAKSLEEIKNGDFTIIDVEKAIDLPSIYVDKKKGKAILDGKEVEYLPIQNSSFKLYSENDFFGIANNKKEGILQIEVFLKD